MAGRSEPKNKEQIVQIDEDMLREAGRAGLIAPDRVDDLWRFLQQCSTSRQAGFQAAHIIYYLGGLIALSAMTLFVSLSWRAWEGGAMLMVALAYAAVGVILTHYFLNRGQRVPAGLALTFAVGMTPLAVYSIEVVLGWWQGGAAPGSHFYRMDWREVMISAATVLTAAIALWCYRLPLVMLLLTGASWYLLMEVLPTIVQQVGDGTSWRAQRFVALMAGLLFMGVGVLIDWRCGRRIDYAFWWYLVGAGSFWGALTSMDASTEWGRFLYFCINLLLLLAGAMLVRRVFAVFAFIGILLYLYHLADYVFHDSLLFPVALAALGLIILVAGWFWQRHEERIQGLLQSCLPQPLAVLLDRVRKGAG